MAKKEVKVSEPEKTAVPAFYPMSTLRDDIDSAFDRMFRDWPRFGKVGELDPFRELDFWKRPTALAPRVDVSEDENAYQIAAEIPGVKEKDVTVTVANGKLTLRGEKKTEKEEKKKDYHMKERSYGAFERSFQLPDGVKTDKISATFENGVLNVTLPKSTKAKGKERKIEVKKKK
jgi:HSP20 family protein